MMVIDIIRLVVIYKSINLYIYIYIIYVFMNIFYINFYNYNIYDYITLIIRILLQSM